MLTTHVRRWRFAAATDCAHTSFSRSADTGRAALHHPGTIVADRALFVPWGRLCECATTVETPSRTRSACSSRSSASSRCSSARSSGWGGRPGGHRRRGRRGGSRRPTLHGRLRERSRPGGGARVHQRAGLRRSRARHGRRDHRAGARGVPLHGRRQAGVRLRLREHRRAQRGARPALCEREPVPVVPVGPGAGADPVRGGCRQQLAARRRAKGRSPTSSASGWAAAPCAKN